uniref:1-aminocyclopropane-1-carboxylate synthase-like protein 1 n=1 Tax=Petromyzon marinus TaxID=7757 RepID=A0AAJ7WPD5_PETMA|nr:1-aminocyclopropane-1-carboxylate synthase-like protein 1 [Petromyzon marinus]XP_032804894.1 1-aminocyclopropane-1-carboxylate synthase-like protein 1 [Petromyzon marinus]XP_032804895.1 1-aminocyclopropane-1-carboxylate synthase-like protein 1 [Petromyzon marinus]XP_032804896.1 1-aminocyclopropane-1-carboxylate synthase-like protein 1 [Petromyzon marinus]XP_032804897.1 1-aminocyclopropane-1-carboxylate synthase-like protein 1 [Petromyzon marinus]XP_032804898.1 1-aminocyclopropane-1-carboxyl
MERAGRAGGAASTRHHPCDSSSTRRSSSSSSRSLFLSERGHRIMSYTGILQDGFSMYSANKFDEARNPEGIINLGTSENKLSVDLMATRLGQPDMYHVDPVTLCYGDWRGHAFLKKEMARFLTDYCKAPRPLDSENVVVVNGCGSLFTALSAVLCDPGDGILIPTPYYGIIDEDIRHYSGVRTVHVPLSGVPSEDETHPFQLTVPKLETALEAAKKEGMRIRAVILINPNNPLGDIYPADALLSYLEFAKRHELHVIMDEIYMLTIFIKGPKFTSVLSFDRLPDPDRTHVMWSLSKDFAASGLRVGVLYTENRDVIRALGKVAYVHGVPGPLQYSVSQILRDREWIDRVFLPTNHERLRKAHRYMTDRLRAMGVPYLERASGLYVWADFRQFLQSDTFVAEKDMWIALIKSKVLISPGQAFYCPEPGWVRLVFAESMTRLKLGMDRLESALPKLKLLTNSAQTSKGDQPNASSALPSDSLEDLIGLLRKQIHSSDWLEQNKAEHFAKSNPEVYESFQQLLKK